MRTFFFLLLFPLLSWSVTLKPTLDGTDQIRFAKYMESVVAAEKVVNSAGFRARVGAMVFTSTKMSGLQVLQKMDEASEILKPGKDGIWDWKVGFYYKKGTRVIGWTNAGIMTVWVNKHKFDSMELAEISANVVHEYLHKIGFDHASAKDHKSVPYALGYLVRDMIRAGPTPAPNTTPAPTAVPRRSWWRRLLWWT